ncbi:MAG: hypothetical protein RBR28_09835 [Lentimicrobium sp.]|nr:hypothetical protein [Lentimicrobium sp.]
MRKGENGTSPRLAGGETKREMKFLPEASGLKTKDQRPKTKEGDKETEGQGEIADCGLQIADCRLQIADCRLQFTDHRSQITDYRSQITDHTSQITKGISFPIHYVQHGTNFQLLTSTQQLNNS